MRVVWVSILLSLVAQNAPRPDADPRIEKVVLNMGIGEAITNAKLVDAAAEELTKIAGQRAAAVKTYVVTERGIDGARVTTRSYAATRPDREGRQAETGAGGPGTLS